MLNCKGKRAREGNWELEHESDDKNSFGGMKSEKGTLENLWKDMKNPAQELRGGTEQMKT